MIAFAALVSLHLSAAHAQGDKGTRPPAGSASAPSYAVLQQQLLDAAKRANEQALEQIKAQAQDAVKASKDAINQANKTATEAANQNKQVLETLAAVSEKTIKIAQESNAFSETILKLWTGALALIAAIFGFFGWKQFKSVLAAAVTQVKAEGAAQMRSAVVEANASMSGLLQDMREKARTARLLTIDLGLFTIDPLIKAATPEKQDPLLIAELFERLTIMEKYAITLEDTRSQCWIHGQRALIHYYTGDYLKAWENQEIAFPLLVDITKFHVHQNLACFTSKVFETRKDDIGNKARTRSREVLLALVEYVAPHQAQVLVKDPDIAAILNAEADVKKKLEAIANRMQSA